MASTSETGYAKNVANFEDLILKVETLGPAYNPSKENLKLAALKTQLAGIQASMQATNKARSQYAVAVDARQAAFVPLPKLAGRVLNMLKASVTDQVLVETAAASVKKIRGDKSKRTAEAKAETDATETPKRKISTSQRSYDLMSDNFASLIEVLNVNKAYNPNEAELKVTALSAFLADLKAKTKAVIIAEAELSAARTNRNNLMSAEGTGLIDTAAGVKFYIKGAFTPGQAQYKEILKLPFKTPAQ